MTVGTVAVAVAAVRTLGLSNTARSAALEVHLHRNIVELVPVVDTVHNADTIVVAQVVAQSCTLVQVAQVVETVRDSGLPVT